MVFLMGKSESSKTAFEQFVARYECFSRATQPEISLLVCATEALELSGFKWINLKMRLVWLNCNVLCATKP